MKLNLQSIQHWMLKLKKNQLKKDPSQTNLTCQVLNSGHETEITSYK